MDRVIVQRESHVAFSGRQAQCGTSLVKETRQPVNGFDRIVMFPDPHDYPALCCEMCISLAVSMHVALELRTPPGGVCCGPSAVLRAPMPVAAIHEHGYAEPCERDIDRTSRQTGNVEVDTKSETPVVEEATYRQLRSRVGSTLTSHPRRYAR